MVSFSLWFSRLLVFALGCDNGGEKSLGYLGILQENPTTPPSPVSSLPLSSPFMPINLSFLGVFAIFPYFLVDSQEQETLRRSFLLVDPVPERQQVAGLHQGQALLEEFVPPASSTHRFELQPHLCHW